MHRLTPRRSMLVALLASSVVLTACGSGAEPSSPSPTEVPSSFAPTTVTLLTHDSFALTETLLTDFAARTGITVKVVTGGDAGEVVNKAALTAGNPEGDVLFGVDNTLLSRAITAGVFDPYVSPAAASVAADLRVATKDVVTPVDYGDVCVNIDDAWFAEKKIAKPTTLLDLAKPAYRDLLVVENAATSSPGLAFLLATVAEFGEDGYEGYWRSLRENGVKVVNGWTEAYEGEFSAGGKGSPAARGVLRLEPAGRDRLRRGPQAHQPSTSVMTDGCFRQVEYAGVLKGTTQPAGGARGGRLAALARGAGRRAAVDVRLPGARTASPLPQVFAEFAATPTEPLTIDPALIDENRAAWIEAWDQVTLR